MSDVTFGVKVTEEMKNELSELMKVNDLSGKEFMSLLLSTYKLEQAKQEDPLFSSDMRELQILLQRIQNIYLNISEKSTTLLNHNKKQFDEETIIHETKNKELIQVIDTLKAQLEASQLENQKQAQAVKNLQQVNKELEEQVKDSTSQAKNYLLLHTKFEQEINQLNHQIESLKRLEIEIEERNAENTMLKNRNDELASEIWFLKREVEKITEEKNQLTATYELELKNQLLEQKLILNEKITLLKEENMVLHQEFNEKLSHLYKTIQKSD